MLFCRKFNHQGNALYTHELEHIFQWPQITSQTFSVISHSPDIIMKMRKKMKKENLDP